VYDSGLLAEITPGPVFEAIQSQEKPEAEIAPFYDPIDDDKNDMWAAKQRQGRKSDAVLSCPACFTILCIDCQRYPYIFHLLMRLNHV
jgi:hypothetical protein